MNAVERLLMAGWLVKSAGILNGRRLREFRTAVAALKSPQKTIEALTRSAPQDMTSYILPGQPGHLENAAHLDLQKRIQSWAGADRQQVLRSGLHEGTKLIPKPVDTRPISREPSFVYRGMDDLSSMTNGYAGNLAGTPSMLFFSGHPEVGAAYGSRYLLKSPEQLLQTMPQTGFSTVLTQGPHARYLDHPGPASPYYSLFGPQALQDRAAYLKEQAGNLARGNRGGSSTGSPFYEKVYKPAVTPRVDEIGSSLYRMVGDGKMVQSWKAGRPFMDVRQNARDVMRRAGAETGLSFTPVRDVYGRLGPGNLEETLGRKISEKVANLKQTIMEGIIPLEQQVMSKLTKALNYRRMMDRIAAQTPKAFHPQLPDVQATPDEITQGFQEIRKKLAAEVPPDQQQHPVAGTLNGLMTMMFGKQIVDRASPYARGKDVGWHGSNPANYAAMKQEGIKTMGEMGERGKTMVGHVLSPEAREASKNLAFIARQFFTGKDHAHGYQAQATLSDNMNIGAPPDMTNLHAADHNLRYEARRALLDYNQRLADETFKRDDRLPWEVLKNKLTLKRPLQIEFPHGGGPKLVENPEIESLREAPMFIGDREDAIKNLLKEPGVEGGIASEFIHGGKGFKWLSGAGIKKSPLRALAGLLGVGGGIGLAGMGARGIYENLKPLDKQSNMNTQFPTVEAMLKGISTTPHATKGKPDCLTEHKVATMCKEANMFLKGLAVGAPTAGGAMLGAHGAPSGHGWEGAGRGATAGFGTASGASFGGIAGGTLGTILAILAAGKLHKAPKLPFGPGGEAGAYAEKMVGKLLRAGAAGGVGGAALGAGTGGYAGYHLANKVMGAPSWDKPASHHRSEHDIKARRRKILSLLLPVLGGGAYGAALGGMAGSEQHAAGEGALIGGGLGAGLGAAGGGLNLLLSKYMGVDPMTHVQDSMKVAKEIPPAAQHMIDQIREGQHRTAVTGMDTGLGAGIGLVEGGRLGRALTSMGGRKAGLLEKIIATLGGQAFGGIGGGVAGSALARHNLGPASWEAKAAMVKDPQGISENLGNLSELKKLVDMASTNPEKLKPAEDVLQDQSMTVPFGVVRGTAGAAGGAVLGNLLSRLVTGPIDPNASERTARDIRKKRNLGAGVGGALGLYLASRKDLQDPHILDSIRQRFAV